MGRVEGKVCVVTGGGSGLGATTARLLAQEGGRVVVADVDTDAAAAVAAELDGLAVALDVTDEAAWQRALDEVETSLGGIHVLVNNAGIVLAGTVETCTLEEFEQIAAVNTNGPYLGMKHAIWRMRRTGERCSIVNLSSIAGTVGVPYVFAYAASKGAVRAMSRSAAVYCSDMGDRIRVNTILPSGIRTPMTDGIADQVAEVRQQDPKATVALPGSPRGEPEDIGFAVLYLASDESKHVNGAELVIDNTITSREGVVTGT